jgi:carbonic anhydrase
MQATIPDSETVVSFDCWRVEFHVPAEHELDGDTFDLEMQVYCTPVSGSVVSFPARLVNLYNEGSEDIFVDPLIWNESVPSASGTLPNFYSYIGSSTQPPCSEGNYWYINTESHTVLKKTLDFFDA